MRQPWFPERGERNNGTNISHVNFEKLKLSVEYNWECHVYLKAFLMPHVFAFVCEHTVCTEEPGYLLTSLQLLYCSSEKPEGPGLHKLCMRLTRVMTLGTLFVCACSHVCVRKGDVRSIGCQYFLILFSCYTWRKTHMGPWLPVVLELQCVLSV